MTMIFPIIPFIFHILFSAHASELAQTLPDSAPCDYIYGGFINQSYPYPAADYIGIPKDYRVVRDVVRDFGADNTGTQCASAAIQRAINAGGERGPSRSTTSYGTTGKPAVVYFPQGTYLMDGSIQLYAGTVLIGDLRMHNFYIGMKNLVIDSVDVDPGRELTLLDWTLSQATLLENVVFNMAKNSSHRGISTWYEFNSNIIVLGQGSWRLVKSVASTSAANTLVLDNIVNDGVTLEVEGEAIITGNIENMFLRGSKARIWFNATSVYAPRSLPLIQDGKYLTLNPPSLIDLRCRSYAQSTQDWEGSGTGFNDDTWHINRRLAWAAKTGSLLYWPAGIYTVTNTIYIPAGLRLVGDPFATVILAKGDNFKDPDNPKPVVQVGEPGEKGSLLMSDFIISVAEPLPGAKLLEVSLSPDDTSEPVHIRNVHFRVGGSLGTTLRTGTNCTENAASCPAAWCLLHLAPSSGAYIKNMWGWTADHDLDRPTFGSILISTGRRALIESTNPTWLIGTGFEHNTLYQYNFHGAKDVFMATGMRRAEL
ncbi:pectin lyase-like protein [Eremomyces bilateralis CBS 781.70]|uniref:Pectin lyase-like protein n=1 Tax=Eremomyces bilateralis CBS 781.70 TaxID=1392243 RepID=A0A6G1FW55_9PEZI|nr:pectin lyase-like protein [Eremomyces bilateralis CBS 781.70]KAF1809958.1 pectin lyase-like protein [Eremomyces bilateralis CBS 781.70]